MLVVVRLLKLIKFFVLPVLFALTACDDGSSSADTSPPVVGTGITATDGSTGVVLNWGAASDPPSNGLLSYKVIYSTANNISTVSDATANGTMGMDWTISVTNTTVTGLTSGTLYYFTVGVRDTSSNTSIYPVVSATTAQLLACPSGQIMTGISGRKGGIIDKLTVRCAPVVGGAVDTAATADSSTLGGSGGVAFGPFTCPTGEWVTGVNGYNASGGFTDSMSSVQVTCSGSSQSPSYNTGGNTAFNYSCAAGTKATAFVISSVWGGNYTGFMRGITCQ